MSRFQVSKKEISALDDTQARELIARLCKAEVARYGFSQKAVSWGGDQRAKDGGVDVDVFIESGKINGFIPSLKTVFQVKAVRSFTASNVKKEMAPEGTLKPLFSYLNHVNGAYVIASTKEDLAAPALNTRLNAMQEIVLENNLNNLSYDFYDSQKIADWTEQYPAIVNWLKSTLGQPFSGWQPYAAWAYGERDSNSHYILDDKVKAYLPNGDESTIQQAISSLRGSLASRGSVRIVGLSGVGKTRLAQALFDKRIETEMEVLDPGNVFYTDTGDDPNPTSQALLERLIEEKSDAIMIVDNCGEQLHSTLTDKINKSTANIKLLTIEYDIQDDLPTNTLCYKLDSSSDELIRELLKLKFDHLSDPDINTIAAFSGGNSRVAFSLASSSESTGELARLRDADLFKRLFNQHNEESDNLYIVARYASLVYSFDIEKEVEYLCNLSGIDSRSFIRGLNTLKSRGLLQQRGSWRAVLPHAISNRLATEALKELLEPDISDDLLDKAPERLILSFTRRLGYLHESEHAKKLVKKWIEPEGKFSNLTNSQLFDFNYRVFKNLAPVCPESALLTIESYLDNYEFISMENNNRDEITRLLVHLAFDSNFFKRAVHALIKFAQAEEVDRNRNSTRRELQGLFQINLLGTNASPEQRYEILDYLLKYGDINLQELGLLCLNSSLDYRQSSAVFLSDFGARKRDYGWHPNNRDDVLLWYEPIIELVHKLGLREDKLGKQIRDLFANRLRELIVSIQLLAQLTPLLDEFSVQFMWPEGYLAIKEILALDKEDLSDSYKEDLNALVNRLAPQNDKEQFFSLVCSSGRYQIYDLDDKSSYDQSYKDSEGLGEKIANEELLLKLLPHTVSAGVKNEVHAFGRGVGRSHNDPQAMLKTVKEWISEQALENFNPNFVCGVLQGWHKNDPEAVEVFLEGSVEDDFWGEYYPWLETSLNHPLAPNAFTRLIRSISLGLAPVYRYRSLAGGRAIDSFTVGEISQLIEGISKIDTGTSVAAGVLSMAIYLSKEKDKAYQNNLSQACLYFLSLVDWEQLNDFNDMKDYNLQEIVKFSAQQMEDQKLIIKVVKRFFDTLFNVKSDSRWKFGFFINSLLSYFPKFTLDALLERYQDSSNSNDIIDSVESAFSEDMIGSSTAVEYDSEIILTWCSEQPEERYLFITSILPLFVPENRAQLDGEHSTLSKLAQPLFENVQDTKALLDICRSKFFPRSWVGNRSSILEKRLKEFRNLNSVIIAEYQEDFHEFISDIDQWIQKEKERELVQERQESGRFE